MPVIMLQVIIIILIVILMYIVYKLANGVKISRHIARFSLDISEDNESLLTTLNKYFWSLISKLSKGLNKYFLINKLSLKYDKYILEVNKDTIKNTDYFAIKLIIIIGLFILSIIFMIFSILPSSILVFIIAFLIGYFIPDLFWSYIYIKKTKEMEKEITNSIKSITKCLNNNLSMEESLKYAIKHTNKELSNELTSILNDIKNNINIEDAYLRFYKRTKIRNVKYIYEVLMVGNKLNISKKDIFSKLDETLEKELVRRNNYLKVIDAYNYLFMIVLIIPVVTYLFGVSLNFNYFSKLFMDKGIYLVIVIIILYSIYIYLIKNILEGYDE